MSEKAEQYSWITGKLLRNSALKHWGKLTRLGETILAYKLINVRQKLELEGYSNTPSGRGMALRGLIASLIEDARPQGETPDFTQGQWRMHFILEEQYLKQRTTNVLIGELGISKSTYFRDQIAACDLLAERLRQRESDLIRQNAKQRVCSSNMPFPLPKLVGRDTLLEKIENGLSTSGAVALTGLPGVGKTALAITVANRRDSLSHFPDGVLWAGIGKSPNILTVLAEWAHALGIRGDQERRSSEEWAKALHKAIGSRRFLLVIDDVWHLEDALAFRIGGKNCAHLITTRSPEIAIQFSPENSIVVNELDEEAGIELLTQIAPEAVEMKREDCKNLIRATGGLPLALVLIGNHLRVKAYRKRLRSLLSAFERLKQPVERLSLQEPSTPTDAHPSLPVGAWVSLQRIIQISYDALTIPAQLALQALSLFPPKPNTFSEAAATTVLMGSPDMLDELAIEHGLLEISGPDRYTLHRTIVDFAQALLKDDGPARRLVDYYLEFSILHQNDPIVLDPEINNILNAVKAARELGKLKELVQCTNALYRYWQTRGLYDVANRYLEQALEVGRRIDDFAGIAGTLHNLGRVAVLRSEYDAAKRFYQRAKIEAKHSQDLLLVCAYQVSLGTLAARQGNLETAEITLEKALKLARKLNSQTQISSILINLGGVSLELGALVQSRRYYEEARTQLQDLRDPRRQCLILQNLGTVLSKLGEHSQAEQFYKESLIISKEMRDQERVSALLGNLSVQAYLSGAYEQSKSLIDEGLKIAAQIDNKLLISRHLTNRGVLLTRIGNFEEAGKSLQQALGLAETLMSQWDIVILYNRLGDCYLRQSRWADARDAFTAALAIGQTEGYREQLARACFGLAQIEYKNGDMDLSRDFAARSLQIFETMGHRKAREARDWIDEYL